MGPTTVIEKAAAVTRTLAPYIDDEELEAAALDVMRALGYLPPQLTRADLDMMRGEAR